MTFTDNDYKWLKDPENKNKIIEIGCEFMQALLTRMEGDESLLDRAIERMKLINGPETKCLCRDSDVEQCFNHKWIRDAEAWRKAGGK